jgi:hypothetical protein
MQLIDAKLDDCYENETIIIDIHLVKVLDCMDVVSDYSYLDVVILGTFETDGLVLHDKPETKRLVTLTKVQRFKL